MAFLPQFVDTSRGRVTLQIILFGAILACLGTTSDCAYALAAGRFGKWIGKDRRLLKLLHYVAGSVYLGLGLGTALRPILIEETSLQGETKRQKDEYQRADFDFSMLLIPNIVARVVSYFMPAAYARQSTAATSIE